jgi:hypothetical protein
MLVEGGILKEWVDQRFNPLTKPKLAMMITPITSKPFPNTVVVFCVWL